MTFPLRHYLRICLALLARQWLKAALYHCCHFWQRGDLYFGSLCNCTGRCRACQPGSTRNISVDTYFWSSCTALLLVMLSTVAVEWLLRVQRVPQYSHTTNTSINHYMRLRPSNSHNILSDTWFTCICSLSVLSCQRLAGLTYHWAIIIGVFEVVSVSYLAGLLVDSITNFFG